MQDMDDIATDANVQDSSNVEHHVPNFSDEPGKCEKARTRLMSEMRATLQNLGWTDDIPGSLHPVVDIRPPPPGVKQNGAEWKTVVAQKRAEVLQQCSQNMPADSNPMPNPGVGINQFVPDNVHVITKSYLSCFFVSKELLQSTQFFILLPTPSTLRTHHTSHTNHTDPSEYIPTNSTTIDTSQSTHTHATHFL